MTNHPKFIIYDSEYQGIRKPPKITLLKINIIFIIFSISNSFISLYFLEDPKYVHIYILAYIKKKWSIRSTEIWF